jgi:hypothetical protein
VAAFRPILTAWDIRGRKAAIDQPTSITADHRPKTASQSRVAIRSAIVPLTWVLRLSHTTTSGPASRWCAASRSRGFQERGQSGGTEAVFRSLDGADESPLIQQVKRRMLDVCPVGKGIRFWGHRQRR